MRNIFLIVGLLTLVSCATPHKDVSSVNVLDGVETILVMPFQNLYAVYGDKVRIDCAFCNRHHVNEALPEGSTDFMTEHLKKLLLTDGNKSFIFSEQSGETLLDLKPDQNGAVRMTELVRTFGDTNGVDAVLVGYLFRFKERVGTRYSVETPASVSFSLFLTRVTDGRVLWRAIFEETQQSLSENFLKIGAFLRRKARWLSAREMAADGLENLMLTFPKP